MRMVGILLLLLLLPFGNGYILSWKEFVRLGVIILLGTYFLLSDLRKKAKRASDFSSLSYVLAIIYYITLLFVITQFDPLLNSLKYSAFSPFQKYWFIICSSGLIIWGLGETLSYLKRTGNRVISPSFKNTDFIIGIVGAVVIILFLLTKLLYKFQTNYVVLVKIVEYGILWFIVSRLAGVASTKGNFLQIDVGGKLTQYRRFCRLDFIAIGVMSVIFLLGMLRMGGSIYYSHKGHTLLRSGDVEGAFAHYVEWFEMNQLLEFWVDQPLINFSALLAQKADSVRFEQALAVLEKRQNNLFQRHQKVGEVWFRGGNWNEAIKEFETLYKNGSVDEEVREKLALCYLREGYQRRFLYLAKNGGVPNIPAENYEINLSLGLVYFHLKHYQQAARYFQKASEYHSGDFLVRYEWGRSLLAMGKVEDAKKLFEYSLNIKPDFADCFFQLGKCYAALGEDTLAQNAFKRAIDLVPTHLEALYAIKGKKEFIPNSQGNFTEEGLTPENWTCAEFGDIEMLGYSLGKFQENSDLDVTFFWKLTGTISPTSKRVQIFLFDEITGSVVVNETPFFKRQPVTWQMGEVIKESYSLHLSGGKSLDRRKTYRLVVYVLFYPDPVEVTTHAWSKSGSFIVENITF